MNTGDYNYLMDQFEAYKLSPSGRADFTPSASLQPACSRPLRLHVLQLADEINSTREISRLDLAIWDDVTLTHLLKAESVRKTKIEKALDIDELSKDIYLALSKDSDDSLARKVIQGLEIIKQNGTYNLILQKYQF